MYIQITTKCNMLCEHCGMNCTAKGENMSFKTFKKAIAESSGYITIGGGEPTIHPQFEKFLIYAVSQCDAVNMITNGKRTNIAIALAKLAENNDNLSVYLSKDPYHEKIDEVVVKMFYGNYRDTSRNLVNAGRCDFGNNDECICAGDPFVKPNGNVMQCGCNDSPCVGNVFDGFTSLNNEEDEAWKCHKEL